MSDLPDFWANRYVNVVAQDLGELINRPKYGTAKISSGIISCAADSLTTLLEVAGKGITYGGVIYLRSTISHKTDVPYLVIDDETMAGESFNDYNNYGMIRPGVGCFFITGFDDTNYVYCVGIQPGITFESSLDLAIFNAQPSAQNVAYTFVYALI